MNLIVNLSLILLVGLTYIDNLRHTAQNMQDRTQLWQGLLHNLIFFMALLYVLALSSTLFLPGSDLPGLKQVLPLLQAWLVLQVIDSSWYSVATDLIPVPYFLAHYDTLPVTDISHKLMFVLAGFSLPWLTLN